MYNLRWTKISFQNFFYRSSTSVTDGQNFGMNYYGAYVLDKGKIRYKIVCCVDRIQTLKCSRKIKYVWNVLKKI